MERDQIRKLARSEFWLSRGILSEKYSQSLFKEPLNELSANRVELAEWTLFYLSLQEKSEDEKPREDIWKKLLDYDIMLDDWLKKERERKQLELKRNKNRETDSYSNFE